MDHIHNSIRTEQIKAMRERTAPVERSREYWTEEELQELESMFAEGVGMTDMALTLHRSELAIFIRIQGLYPKVRSPRQAKDGCFCQRCPGYVAETHECQSKDCALSMPSCRDKSIE